MLFIIWFLQVPIDTAVCNRCLTLTDAIITGNLLHQAKVTYHWMKNHSACIVLWHHKAVSRVFSAQIRALQIVLNLFEASVKALLVATYRHLLPVPTSGANTVKLMYALYRVAAFTCPGASCWLERGINIHIITSQTGKGMCWPTTCSSLAQNAL